MKKYSIVFLVFSSIIFSCSKSDTGSGNGGSGSNSPQITGTTFTTTHVPGAKFNNYRLDSGIIKVQISGTALQFNYAGVPNGTPWSDTLKAPTNFVDFAGATYTIGRKDSLFGQSFSLFRYYKTSSTSWTIMGDDNDAISITIPGTGSASIPKQAVKKIPNQILVQFPIVYGDSLLQTSLSSLNLNVSIPPTPPLNTPINGPVTINQETKVNSKNICWGTLKIKGYTDSLQTVVQRYTTTVTNNFTSTNFLINALLPGLLSGFGMTNGQAITTTTYRFWVPNKGLVMTLNADGSATVTTGL